MRLKTIPFELTVCRIADISDVSISSDFFFLSRTDEELSLVCRTADAPSGAIAREDGWRGFRIEGILDFSLIGILSKISSILAENRIGIFAVSTYNTDYILVKKENFGRAMALLEAAGYEVSNKGTAGVRKLTDFSQVERLYHTWMKEDFLPEEIKPLDTIYRMWMKKSYDCYGLFDGDEILGYAFFLRGLRGCLLDYFAIAKGRRDEGLGSLFLRQLAERFQGSDCIVIEAENPDRAEDGETRKHRERRLRFYLRNGCRKTGITATVFGVDYCILEIPESAEHTDGELRSIYAELYRSMLPEPVFRKQVQIC